MPGKMTSKAETGSRLLRREGPHSGVRCGRRRRCARVGAAAVATVGLLTGCGLGTAGGYVPSGELAGPLADLPRLEGAQVAVGSKNFTEQLVVGKMAVILLQSAGAHARDLTNIPGSASSRQAQLEGQVQMSWEYTGTAWIAYLGHDAPIPDEQQQYEAVRDEDLAVNDLVWLKPAPMNNTYGFAMGPQTAERLGITKMSQWAELPPEERTFCVGAEFNSRDDGLQPMLKTYDVPLGPGVPKEQVNLFDSGAIYQAVTQGECNFGEVFTTDGRIPALNLTVLADDRNFFPNYNIAMVVREETLEEYPQLRELFETVSKKMTDEALMVMNARVDVDGEEPATVAFEWLQQEGFIVAND